MRNSILVVGFVSAWLFAAAPAAHAQSILVLPRESQASSVSQTLGVTDVSIHYSRPLVKGRKVWGGLVPYNDVWRAGPTRTTPSNSPIRSASKASRSQRALTASS